MLKTLNVYFYEQPLLFYKTDKSYSGVEADIIGEFIKGCAEKKKITVKLFYYSYPSFWEFYAAMKTAPENSLGAGTVTITKERMNDFDFSSPYIKNVAVFVSHGSLTTLDTGFPGTFRGLSEVGLSERGSLHTE